MTEEDEAFEELAMRQGSWQHTSGWRKKQIQQELSIKVGGPFHVVCQCDKCKALAEHAMRETQRLGQEIEQEPYSVQQAYAMAQVCLDLHKAIGCKWGDNVYLAIDQLKVAAHPPQPEQEPVAWLSTDSIGEMYLCFDKPLDNDPVQPLYTAPPQRTWVGLTEQEHTEIAVECGCMSADWVFYGAAVERKLKERNT